MIVLYIIFVISGSQLFYYIEGTVIGACIRAEQVDSTKVFRLDLTYDGAARVEKHNCK